ncbi:hypothetical protein HNR44_000670 [Geomicrobium halophilum]|uniref:Uncharacterized protein n=1 Tax=Geomicrobium halophilum TaxID=549000 RepID=A0A841PR02_9BACL|nr:hypothetical protein [Geomicrobium halophilum]MBB6448721.1 hypothetical protein [Geomicrobium halophilum]
MYVDQFPKAYMDWIKTLEMEGERESVLQATIEGLSTIPSHYTARAEVAEKLSEIGEELGDLKLKLKGFREGFYFNPSMKYLLDLYMTAHEEGCFDEIREEVEERMIELKNKGKNSASLLDIERKRATFNEKVFYYTHLLGGNYEKVFHMCEGKDPLG